MIHLTKTAKIELQNRLKLTDTKQLIRLQMRKSCFMKMKLAFEESIQPNDTEIVMDGMHFLIDKGEYHYFNEKKLILYLTRLVLNNLRLFRILIHINRDGRKVC